MSPIELILDEMQTTLPESGERPGPTGGEARRRRRSQRADREARDLARIQAALEEATRRVRRR